VVTEHAAVFDGLDDYVEVADHPDHSIATTGELTVVALIRPDSLEMPAQERTGYVHLDARAGGTLDSAITATAGLVGFWRLGASS
jgi:hypothetical protein